MSIIIFAMIYRIKININKYNTQGAEKLHAKTLWGNWGYQNRDFFLSLNYVWDASLQHIRPSNWVRLSKTTKVLWQKVVFCTYLQEMFKRMTTDINTQ